MAEKPRRTLRKALEDGAYDRVPANALFDVVRKWAIVTTDFAQHVCQRPTSRFHHSFFCDPEELAVVIFPTR